MISYTIKDYMGAIWFLFLSASYFDCSTRPSRRLNTVRTHLLNVMWAGSCLLLYREQELAHLAQSEHMHSPVGAHNSPPPPPSSSEPSTSPSAHSIPQFQHPSHMLLKANGFQQQQYSKYRQNCLRGLCKA